MPVTASIRALSKAAREDTTGDYFTVPRMARSLDTRQTISGSLLSQRLLPTVDLPIAQFHHVGRSRRCCMSQPLHDRDAPLYPRAVGCRPLQIRMQQQTQPIPVSRQHRFVGRLGHVIHEDRILIHQGQVGNSDTNNCAVPGRYGRARQCGWGCHSGDTAASIARRHRSVDRVADRRWLIVPAATGLPAVVAGRARRYAAGWSPR